MLFDLPIELIQLVLHHASTPSYLQAAVSCRTLFEIASTCREVVLHHLEQTPGLTLGIDSGETKELFLLLRKHAAKQLYGANFHANRTLYLFEGRVIDVRASSITASGVPNVALTVKGDGAVHLFDARDGSLCLRASLQPPYEQPGTVEVLRTAFGEDNSISVLQRFNPKLDLDGDELDHPFIKQAMQSPSGCEMYLARYAISSPHEHVTICTFPDHTEYEPLALAVASKHKFAVSWQHTHDNNQHEVVIYNCLSDSQDESSPVNCLRYRSTVVVDEHGRWPEGDDSLQGRLAMGDHVSQTTPVTHLTFNDRTSQLLYYHRACTLYSTYQNLHFTSSSLHSGIASRLYSNCCRVQFSDSLNLPFSIAIPFFGTHDTYQVAPNHQTCHWKYLAFGIGTHREKNWTVACLLTSEARCRASNCGHELNRERGRRLTDWKIVARLRGYRNPTNSLGCIVAASAQGTRIAVANWNVISIWAIEPEELIEGNANGFYPPCWQLTESAVVELRPIVLRLDAVCFKLCFTARENELLALTDRGLMYWELGPQGTGARATCKLVAS